MIPSSAWARETPSEEPTMIVSWDAGKVDTAAARAGAPIVTMRAAIASAVHARPSGRWVDLRGCSPFIDAWGSRGRGRISVRPLLSERQPN